MTSYQHAAARRARMEDGYRIGLLIGRTIRTIALLAFAAWLAVEAHAWVAYWSANPPVM